MDNKQVVIENCIAKFKEMKNAYKQAKEGFLSQKKSKNSEFKRDINTK